MTLISLNNKLDPMTPSLYSYSSLLFLSDIRKALIQLFMNFYDDPTTG